MDEMFYYALSFNQPLNNWNVSKVTDMEEMFWIATSFNQPLDNWNVSNVTDMVGMFESTRFNQPLNKWDVSNVANFESSWREAMGLDRRKVDGKRPGASP